MLENRLVLFCEKCEQHYDMRLERKDLQNMLKSIRIIDGTEYFQGSCPYCNEIHQYPFERTYRKLKEKDERLKYGLKMQKIFQKFWAREYAPKYGTLVLTDKNPYTSEPDFYNEALKTHFEFKTKWQSWDFIVKQDNMAWINQKSIDYKKHQQDQNPNQLYTAVMYFPDEGYYIITVNDIKTHGTIIEFDREIVYGSGEPAYAVDISLFKKIDEFIKNLQKEREYP